MFKFTSMSSQRRARVLAVLLLVIVLLFLWNAKSRKEGEVLDLTHSTRLSKIAKVSVTINALNESIVAGALRTHEIQNSLHGYQHFILTEALVEEKEDPQGRPLGTWSKPAYLLSLMLLELAKPKAERLEWLFWFDADTIILNPHIPLETFLPPNDPTLSDTHMLLTKNWDGINAGVFPLRVHPWSVLLLSAWIAYPTLHPEEFLVFMDQTALWRLLDRTSVFKLNYSIVPHRWFNSFPINSAFDSNGTWIYAEEMTPDAFDDGEAFHDSQPWKVLKGDMVLHFAGAVKRMSWMEPWLHRTEMYLPQWSSSMYQERRDEEAKAYWIEETVNVTRRNEEYRKAEEVKLEEKTRKKEEEKRKKEQQVEDDKRKEDEKRREEDEKGMEEERKVGDDIRNAEEKNKEDKQGEQKGEREKLIPSLDKEEAGVEGSVP